MKPLLILTPEKIKMIEKRANDAGLSYLGMMEKAGTGCAEYILKKHRSAQNIVILCGKGKNGGDGFVIARLLTAACKSVTVIKLFDTPSDALSESRYGALTGDTTVLVCPKDSAKAASAIAKADVIADAVFGIGFSGTLPENVRVVNRLCNSSGAVKIAIDLPSGVSVNGISKDFFKADETLSMLCLKKEHIYKPFSDCCGKVSVIPIGIEISCTSGLFSLSEAELAIILPKRPFDANKGTFGKAAIIAGSKNMPGAAVIAARGAIASGAGLVSVMYPDVCRNIVASSVPECIGLPLETTPDGKISASNIDKLLDALSSCKAAAFGCGMGVSEDGAELLEAVLQSYTGTLIVDADGINLLAGHIHLLKNTACKVLLTPHPGEMSRLTGLSITEVNDDRERIAAAFAAKHGVFVLLKGPNTVVANPNGNVYINTSGCNALSRGGSGDLLTGIAVSLAAQGKDPFDTLILASFLHGAAGEEAEKRFTAYASTTERITECLPAAFLRLSESL